MKTQYFIRIIPGFFSDKYEIIYEPFNRLVKRARTANEAVEFCDSLNQAYENGRWAEKHGYGA